MNTATNAKEETYRELSDNKGLALVKLNGKSPLESDWTNFNHRDFDKIGFESSDNAGILTGSVNGIIVLDIDDQERFEKALAENNWDLPETYTVRTGSGGHHYYFGYPGHGFNEYRSRAFKALGFDIRANGGQVVAPGSIHPDTGNPYEVEKDLPYTEAPQWLLELSKGTPQEIQLTSIESEDIDLDSIDVVPSIIEKIRNGVPKGQRSEAIWNVMLSLMSAGSTDGQVLKVLEDYPIGDKGREKGADWLHGQIHKARMCHNETNTTITIDDLLDALGKSEQGDADIFRKLFGDRFCYDCRLGKWFKFNGITWEPDVTEEAFSAVAKVADEYRKHAMMLTTRIQRGEELDSKAIKEFTDRSAKLNTVAKRKSVLTLARSGDPSDSLGIYGTEWNSDPWILGCTNGVIDLKTGQLRGGRPQDYIRISAPTTWNGLEEPAPVWKKFIESIFDGSEDLIEYMHRLLGYSLIGQAIEHVMPVLWGKGRNGKSTLFNCLGTVLGDYGAAIQAETLLSSSTIASAASHSSHLFALKDRRLVWTSEVNDGRYFDASVVKRLTGGDKIVGRKAYNADCESFTPTHTIMMLTNAKPRVRDANDYALFQRLHLVPFSLSFVPNPKEDHERKADPDLETKLKSEASGILAWLVRGCLKYQLQGGLNPPKTVVDATKEYQKEEDVLGLFIDSCCDCDSDSKVRTSEMYGAYRDWCTTNGNFPMSSMKFHGKVKDRFTRKKSGVDYYMGVRLVPSVDDPSTGTATDF